MGSSGKEGGCGEGESGNGGANITHDKGDTKKAYYPTHVAVRIPSDMAREMGLLPPE